MPQTNEKWWEEMITDEAKQKSDILELVEYIVSEAERRGYERAMEEVKKASILTTSCVVAPGEEKEEWVDALCIPKSFFEK